ncbi:MAG: hypothetical protein ACD_76C00077G0003 [uncultured bacterium]|nr:MAG: hypothetical protein ACD_76C00077G0003 [uncultured bacterium]HBD05308.1 hypothetical protein [Candidatus Uhrbacteria bacterium]
MPKSNKKSTVKTKSAINKRRVSLRSKTKPRPAIKKNALKRKKPTAPRAGQMAETQATTEQINETLREIALKTDSNQTEYANNASGALRMHINESVPQSQFVISLSKPVLQTTQNAVSAVRENEIEDIFLDLILPEPEDDDGVIFEKPSSLDETEIQPDYLLISKNELESHETRSEINKRPLRALIPNYSLPSFNFRLFEKRRTAQINSGNTEPDREISKPRNYAIVTALPIGWKRAMASFVGLSFIFVLPLHAMDSYSNTKNRTNLIISESGQGLQKIIQAKKAIEDSRFGAASQNFSLAEKDFAQMEAELKRMNSDLAGLLAVLPQTSKTYKSSTSMSESLGSLSAAAKILASSYDSIKDNETITITDKLALVTQSIQNALPLLESAAQSIVEVDAKLLPQDKQELVKTAQTQVPGLAMSARDFLESSEFLHTVLGGKEPMRYLLLFQNNSELRPTGGFMGSFAEIDIENGAIKSINIPAGGTYDMQGSLHEFVEAPIPLRLVNPRWEFQDSNWFPDFEQSAKKTAWFYEKAGGPTVDGVIAVNATFVANLLDFLGTIEMPDYGISITNENFLFETQKIVELEYDKTENKPKQFIADLAPALLERINSADAESLFPILANSLQALEQKDIQMYFPRQDLQQTAAKLGWTGKVHSVAGDYLMIVNANIGGGKTDLIIDQDISLRASIQPDGRIINTLTIKKTHKGMASELFQGLNNVDYMRVFVPRGSKLIHASGFNPPSDELFEQPEYILAQDKDLEMITGEIFKDPASGTLINDEFGKTIFGNWMQVKPGSVSEATFVYELPFTIAQMQAKESLLTKLKKFAGMREISDYSITLQKQSGVETRKTTIEVDAPENLLPIWTSDTENKTDLKFDFTNDTDAYLGILFEKQ